MDTMDTIVLILFVIFMTWIIIGFNKTQFDKYKTREDIKKKSEKKKKKKKD